MREDPGSPEGGTRYLTIEDVLTLIGRSEGVRPVRDLGLLGSATARPRASAFGQPAYPDLATKAAALMQSLAGNCALVDGNKRLALSATAVFLFLNGYEPAWTQDEAFEVTMAVAAGEPRDVEDIAARIALTRLPSRESPA